MEPESAKVVENALNQAMLHLEDEDIVKAYSKVQDALDEMQLRTHSPQRVDVSSYFSREKIAEVAREVDETSESDVPALLIVDEVGRR